MNLSTGQNISIGLEHKVSQRQLQSLHVLEMPEQTLEQQIHHEILTNPFLETEEHFLAAEPEDIPAEQDPRTLEDQNRDDFQEGLENMLENGNGLEDWQDPDLPRNADDSEEANERHQFLLDSIESYGPTLYDDLLDQIRTADLPSSVSSAAETILGLLFPAVEYTENTGNQDEQVFTGFLPTPDADIAQAANCSLETARQAREFVKHLEPSGIGCRDGREFLLFQLEELGKKDSTVYRLLQDFSDDISTGHLDHAAEVMQLPVEKLEQMLQSLRKLRPYPAYGSTAGRPAHFVIPVAEIVPDGEEFKAVLTRERQPRFRLSQHYLDLMERTDFTAEERSIVQEKLNRAKNLLNDLAFRESTIKRILDLITANQHDFFAGKPDSLRPMTRKELAEKLNLAESTVSRALKDKYIRTSRGLLATDAFFSSGYTSSSGETVTSAAIKSFIQDAVNRENPSKPLSDSKLEKLLAEAGHQVARRTIAKYREEMDIPSSSERRKEFS